MKKITCMLFIVLFSASFNASAWIVNGVSSIDKIGINGAQITVHLANGNRCYLDNNFAKYKEMLALLQTLYATKNSAFFRCSETSSPTSPWDPTGAAYLEEVTGQ